MRPYDEKNRDRIREEHRARYRTKGRAKLLARYGLTPEEYEKIRKSQNDCCAVCGRPQSECK